MSGSVREGAVGTERSPARFVRPELRQLRAYTLEQTACRFKLDQNEVPWDFPARWKRQAIARLAAVDWARYPDFHADELRRALGERLAWPMEGILVGNGSNEMLGITLEAVVRPGGEVLGVEPSFGLYEMFVRRAGGRPRFLAPRADLRLQIDELAAEIALDSTRPVLLCSPNNPTGAAATPAQVERLLEALDAPLLLDNAYGEFCRHDYRPLLDRHPHLLLFRTFSKAWSLGGMRLGYLAAHPDLVAELIKVKLPYNLSHAGVAAGLAALAGSADASRRIAVLVARREQWHALLAGFGLTVHPSEGNFLLVDARPAAGAGETPAAACRRLRDGLARSGILVRDVSRYPGLDGCFRIGVGGGPALRAARQALEEILQ
ncbi:MAG TPA: histidinol-phosphate transaminase [Thermoanaerobaculia bacterium]|nr:histidinol-phosphate transaminase [Thermoanaerobaculia bacterium]